MALPPALVQFVESHGCFSGCYGSNVNLHAFFGPTQPAVPLLSVSCEDCLTQIGTAASLLPMGMYAYQLADELSLHVRTLRGYTLSVAGYHAKGPGFWFGAVYWASCNLFLLDGNHSHKLGTDLELLMMAFQHGVLQPPDPGMLNPAAFAVQPIFHDSRQPLPPVASKVDLLSAPSVSLQPKGTWKKLTLAEFVAVSPQTPTAVAPQAAPTAVAPQTAPAAVAPQAAPTAVPEPLLVAPAASRCPKCGAEVRQRQLLHQTFIGCMC